MSVSASVTYKGLIRTEGGGGGGVSVHLPPPDTASYAIRGESGRGSFEMLPLPPQNFNIQILISANEAEVWARLS